MTPPARRPLAAVADWIPVVVLMLTILGQGWLVMDKLVSLERKVASLEARIEVHLRPVGLIASHEQRRSP